MYSSIFRSTYLTVKISIILKLEFSIFSLLLSIVHELFWEICFGNCGHFYQKNAFSYCKSLELPTIMRNHLLLRRRKNEMKEKFHQFEKCFRIYHCVEFLFFCHIINLFGSLILADIVASSKYAC